MVAVPKLLEVVDLEGCMVTLDTMGYQKKIAAAIHEREANYVMRLKDNHPVVWQEVAEFFDHCLAYDPQVLAFDEQVDGRHGRREGRRGWGRDNLQWFTDLDKGRDLSSVVLVESEPHVGDQVSEARRLYLRNWPAQDAAAFQRAIRVHWGIENGWH